MVATVANRWIAIIGSDPNLGPVLTVGSTRAVRIELKSVAAWVYFSHRPLLYFPTPSIPRKTNLVLDMTYSNTTNLDTGYDIFYSSTTNLDKYISKFIAIGCVTSSTRLVFL
jgi:hypothetical protein